MEGLEIAQRRLGSQHLCGAPLADPVAVVRHLGAVQAQEYAVAKWALGQRAAGCHDADVQRALDEGRILRTHALRPTWHFVAAADLGWIQALTGPRVHATNAHYYRLHGLDERMADRTTEVIVSALRGGTHLTRKELAAALAGAGLPATGNRLAYVVLRAELDGVIASGPMRGRQHTYALVAERVPEPLRLDPDAALAELTRRYFTSHGPATVRDFAWWSSLTLAQATRGLNLLDPPLAHRTVDGLTYWYPPDQPAPPVPGPDAHALASYDEYVVAYRESRFLVNLAGRRLGTLYETLLAQPILLDSQVVGYWRRTVAPRGVTVEPVLAIEPSRSQRRAIEAAIDRYRAFAPVPVTVAWPDG